MSDGKKVRVKRNSVSKLPLVELREVNKQEMREIVNKRKQITNEQNQVAALLRQEQDATLMAFTRTHLQPMSTDMALKVMNHPLERSFNMTVKHVC